MKKDKINNVISIFLYAFIYLLFGLIVFLNLRTNYLGLDEPFTFAMIHHSFPSIIQLTAKDVHPFLYYFLAKVCILPFKNVFTQIRVLKLVSALPYLILLIIANTTIKHRFSRKVSLIFMLLLVTVPVLSPNILISRMYGWSMLLTTIIFLLLTYVYKRILPNSICVFIGISLLTLADFYTQYDAIISLVIIIGFFLVLFIHSKLSIKKFLISICVSILLYLPWVKIMLYQMKYVSGSNYYAPRFIFKIAPICKYIGKNIVEVFTMNPNPSKLSQIFILIFILLIIISIFYLSHIKDLTITLMGLSLPFIVMFFGLLICMKSDHQILYPRYLISALGIFWLSISIIITSILSKKAKHNTLKVFLLLFTLIICFESYKSTYIQRIKPYADSLNQSEAVLKLIPNKSNIIFDNPVLMQRISIYKPASENYIEGSNLLDNGKLVDIWSDKGKKAIEGNAYKKVFQRTHLKENLQLPSHTLAHKNTYFVRYRNKSRSLLGNSFYYKYRDKMIKLKSTKAPLSIVGKITLYKIR